MLLCAIQLADRQDQPISDWVSERRWLQQASLSHQSVRGAETASMAFLRVSGLVLGSRQDLSSVRLNFGAQDEPWVEGVGCLA